MMGEKGGFREFLKNKTASCLPSSIKILWSFSVVVKDIDIFLFISRKFRHPSFAPLPSYENWCSGLFHVCILRPQSVSQGTECYAWAQAVILGRGDNLDIFLIEHGTYLHSSLTALIPVIQSVCPFWPSDLGKMRSILSATLHWALSSFSFSHTLSTERGIFKDRWPCLPRSHLPL